MPQESLISFLLIASILAAAIHSYHIHGDSDSDDELCDCDYGPPLPPEYVTDEPPAKCQQDCPIGFTKFKRSSGRIVCFQIVRGKMNYWQAAEKCKTITINGKLMGIENQIEYDWAKNLFGNKWHYLGARRKPECHAPKDVLRQMPQCQDDQMFFFTDGVTVGTFLWNNHWYFNNPDSHWLLNEFESAISMFAGGVGDISTGQIHDGALCGVAIC
ncbi:unnamed protein product [Caenorhabditis bovis]|uniref:C-type lectin domain-containing protein n=1 Tax=Caenorhabditis bovis TaxID=2654633 RepID=A0A8S1ET38_9PELO|nr:unnamed protein product [Caenorhabditis bovis]